MSVDADAASSELHAAVAAILHGNAPALGAEPTPTPIEQPRARFFMPSRDQELGGPSVDPHLSPAELTAASGAATTSSSAKFLPLAPATFAEAGISENDVEGLLLKALAAGGRASGASLAERIALPFSLVNRVLTVLKGQRALSVSNTSSLNDFVYELTDLGRHSAAGHIEHCSYCGPAPVPLDAYKASVAAQSLTRSTPSRAELAHAFSDLTLSPATFERLGRAICAGKGLFLYGAPGNGKTSIAERVTKAYGQTIWIPRVISAWGEIIQLFDPSHHEELPLAHGESIVSDQQIDTRWVRIRRPTIVVGGELTLCSLEITPRPESRTSEAPLQLKSNCGTLVIDDFGRQRISPVDLLNRWIVPLEKRHDYLSLASGRKICVPFDQLIVFSTNLEPRDLVDEAFLRRIPYKIDAQDPSEQQFRELFRHSAKSMGIDFNEPALSYLIDTYFQQRQRPFRFCHPRDLLRQIAVYCQFAQTHPAMTKEAIDAAANDYFTVM